MYNIEKNFDRYMKEIGSDILFSPAPGALIKKIRKNMEVSQEEMAGFLGLRRETLSRIETAAINPTTSFIKSFSKIGSMIKIFRDINALKDSTRSEDIPINPTFIRTHFSLSPDELEKLMRLGNASYYKTKKKVLRRIKI